VATKHIKCDCNDEQSNSAGNKGGKLLIPKEEVAKVLKQKTLGPTGMKGLAAIKNIVEKWSVSASALHWPTTGSTSSCGCSCL